jgi:hypothetical protein
VIRTAILAGAIAGLVCGGARAELPRIPPPVLAAAMKTAECDVPVAEAIDNLEPHDLGHGLMLVEARCWRAVYNFGNVLFVLDPSAPGRARLLHFQLWNGHAFEQTYSLTLPQFDPETKRLTMRHLGRGLGDCGTIGQWDWTGANFRMTGYWSKDDCDGEDFEADDRWRIFPARR